MFLTNLGRTTLIAALLVSTALVAVPSASASPQLPCTPLLPLYDAAICAVGVTLGLYGYVLGVYETEYHYVTCDIIGGPACDFVLCDVINCNISDSDARLLPVLP
jgi:hypothetical protein